MPDVLDFLRWSGKWAIIAFFALLFAYLLARVVSFGVLRTITEYRAMQGQRRIRRNTDG